MQPGSPSALALALRERGEEGLVRAHAVRPLGAQDGRQQRVEPLPVVRVHQAVPEQARSLATRTNNK